MLPLQVVLKKLNLISELSERWDVLYYTGQSRSSVLIRVIYVEGSFNFFLKVITSVQIITFL